MPTRPSCRVLTCAARSRAQTAVSLRLAAVALGLANGLVSSLAELAGQDFAPSGVRRHLVITQIWVLRPERSESAAKLTRGCGSCAGRCGGLLCTVGGVRWGSWHARPRARKRTGEPSNLGATLSTQLFHEGVSVSLQCMRAGATLWQFRCEWHHCVHVRGGGNLVCRRHRCKLG